MITNEEKIVFQYELYKLNREYQQCANEYVKSQLKEEISFLNTILKSSLDRESEVKSTEQEVE
jgi:hypothetical protein